MSKKIREKGYWLKKKEWFDTGAAAKERAAVIRDNEHTAHVLVDNKDGRFVVAYSVAKWYVEELSRVGVKL